MASYLWYWPGGGWNFDKWKSQSKWQPITTKQSGRKELILGTHHDWSRATLGIIGTLMDEPPAQVTAEVLTETYVSGKYRMRRLRYKLTEKEWGYAWFMLPNDAKGPRPVVIALHQTVPQGKNEAVGLEMSVGRTDLGYGKELVEQGFAVFAPDAIAFGERAAGHPNTFYQSADQFFAAHPEGSVMGKMCYDVSRGIDLLETLPEVDASRIGCVGHSHGAYGTLFAMIADQRIRAGVISCGMDLLRTDPNADRWWRKTALMPRLGFYEGQIDDAPIDFHQWVAMIAPRAVMIVNALRDQIFPNTQTLTPAMEIARKAWEDPSKLIYYPFEGAHQFPAEARKKAYEMLARELV